MSGQIKMSPEELKLQAKRYGQGAGRMEEILADLTGLQGELSDQWKGKAFVEFNNQFYQLSDKNKEFQELLRQIETQLEKTANAMLDQDAALSRNFGLS